MSRHRSYVARTSTGSTRGGIFYCTDAVTGKLVYRKRLAGRFYSSPIRAGDAIYAVSRHEGTFVLAAKPEFEQLAHNRIEGDESAFDGTPAAVDGTLFLRSRTHIYCIRKPGDVIAPDRSPTKRRSP